VSRSSELIASKSSSVPFELESLRYPKPLTSAAVGGPLTGAVLPALSVICGDDLVEESKIDLIVSSVSLSVSPLF
jgi:hypothetical protein